MKCAFFGHKDTPDSIIPALETEILDLINKNKDITFYVGHNGSFDRMAISALKKFSEIYPDIKCFVVLAYLNNVSYDIPTLFPEGIETVPPKFAVSYRNDFMVKQCDTVICYIEHNWGGAAQFVEKARKKGRNIINVSSTKI